MDLNVAPIGPSALTAPYRTAVPARPQATPAVISSVTVGEIPDRPPREVLDAVDAAGRAYRTLRAHGRELHFSHDSQTGRLTIAVRDLDGNLLRMIPPSTVLDAVTEGVID